MSRSCYQLLPPCPPHTNTSERETALTASPKETSRTCVIRNESGHLGWHLILEKRQKSLWKRSSSSIGKIVTGAGPLGPGPKTFKSASQMIFHFGSKMANSWEPSKDPPHVDRKLKSLRRSDGRKCLDDILSSKSTLEMCQTI